MDSSNPRQYIVHAAGKKSRAVSRQQITDMCAAGRMAVDATVAAVGSTLHKPILVFLGETEEPEDRSSTTFQSVDTPRPKRKWFSKVLTTLFLLMLLGNIYSVYSLHRLLTFTNGSVLQQIEQLNVNMGALEAQQQNMAAALQQRHHAGPDPLAGRPETGKTEIRKIASAIGDYQQVLQELANEGGTHNPSDQTADAAINRLLGQLQTDFGIGGDAAPTDASSTQSSLPLSQ